MSQKILAMAMGCGRALIVAVGVTLLVSGILGVLVGASEAGVFSRHVQLVHPWTHGCTPLEEAALLVSTGTALLWAGISILWVDSINIRLSRLGEATKQSYVDLGKVSYEQSNLCILE